VAARRRSRSRSSMPTVTPTNAHRVPPALTPSSTVDQLSSRAPAQLARPGPRWRPNGGLPYRIPPGRLRPSWRTSSHARSSALTRQRALPACPPVNIRPALTGSRCPRTNIIETALSSAGRAWPRTRRRSWSMRSSHSGNSAGRAGYSEAIRKSSLRLMLFGGGVPRQKPVRTGPELRFRSGGRIGGVLVRMPVRAAVRVWAGCRRWRTRGRRNQGICLWARSAERMQPVSKCGPGCSPVERSTGSAGTRFACLPASARHLLGRGRPSATCLP